MDFENNETWDIGNGNVALVKSLEKIYILRNHFKRRLWFPIIFLTCFCG